jgi:hypothetical protein
MTDTATTTDNKVRTPTIIYMGRRLSNTGKLAHLFLPAYMAEAFGEADNPDAVDAADRKASWYLPKKDPQLMLGCLYGYGSADPGFPLNEISQIEEINFSALIRGKVRRSDLIDAWAARDRAARAFKAAESEKKKLAASSPLDEPIGRLRYAYWNTPASQRQAFLLALVHQITKA